MAEKRPRYACGRVPAGFFLPPRPVRFSSAFAPASANSLTLVATWLSACIVVADLFATRAAFWTGFAVDFFAVDFFAVDFFAVDFFAVDFFAVDFERPDAAFAINPPGASWALEAPSIASFPRERPVNRAKTRRRMLTSHLRPATRADIPALTALIERSVRGLHRDDYTAAQIEAGLASAYGVDTTLIDDGTYFVLETDGAIVAAGGWSKRKTLCGGDGSLGRDDALLDPHVEAAKIRAFYVDPGSVRRGFGSLLLEACEKAARDAGFTRFEMGATLTGVRLYERRGYLAIENMAPALPGGETLPVVRMVKDDATTSRR